MNEIFTAWAVCCPRLLWGHTKKLNTWQNDPWDDFIALDSVDDPRPIVDCVEAAVKNDQFGQLHATPSL